MIALLDTPLVVGDLLADVVDEEHGATAVFVGTTRREAGERAVAALHYEAYEELALSEMRAIAAEAEQGYGARVSVAHRTGLVEVGSPSVVVATSAAHRTAAFVACRYAIDELKARVPIWKQTVYADGGATWRDGCAHDHHVSARSQHA